MPSSTGSISLDARCFMDDATFVRRMFPGDSVFPLPRSDSVESYLPLGGISCGTCHHSQDKVSNLKIIVSDFGVVVLGHEVLVLR